MWYDPSFYQLYSNFYYIIVCLLLVIYLHFATHISNIFYVFTADFCDVRLSVVYY